MPHKWDKDFRFQAIRTSMEMIGDDVKEDSFDYPFSFCLPASEKPFKGLSPGKLMVLAIVLGFGGLLIGALTATKAEQGDTTDVPLMILALCCSLSGFAFFFLPFLLQKKIVSWSIGERGKELMNRSGANDVIASELGRADEIKISIEGEDHVLILMDKSNQRLLIEGIAARYLIQKKDVVSVAPFQFMNYLGADITYRIGENTKLRVAIAKTSLLKEFYNQLPLLFFLKRWIHNRVLEKVLDTLDVKASEPQPQSPFPKPKSVR